MTPTRTADHNRPTGRSPNPNQEYVTTCKDCQVKARALVYDRTPITVIPRDPIPFNHLYTDVIGPLYDKAE